MHGRKLTDVMEGLIEAFHTIQIYVGDSGAARLGAPMTDAETVWLKRLMPLYDIRCVIHSPHSLNLANADRGQVNVLTLNNLQWQLQGLPASIVVHVGKVGGVAEIHNQLNNQELMREIPLLLENAAGQGTEIGWSLDELRRVWEGIDFTSRIGMCLDTAHAFGAGMCQFADANDTSRLLEEYEALWPKKLRVIHLNDSAKGFGSRVDRHAVLKQGHIWRERTESLKTLLDWAIQEDIEVISETPDWVGDLLVIRELYYTGQ